MRKIIILMSFLFLLSFMMGCGEDTGSSMTYDEMGTMGDNARIVLPASVAKATSKAAYSAPELTTWYTNLLFEGDGTYSPDLLHRMIEPVDPLSILMTLDLSDIMVGIILGNNSTAYFDKVRDENGRTIDINFPGDAYDESKTFYTLYSQKNNYDMAMGGFTFTITNSTIALGDDANNKYALISLGYLVAGDLDGQYYIFISIDKNDPNKWIAKTSRFEMENATTHPTRHFLKLTSAGSSGDFTFEGVSLWGKGYVDAGAFTIGLSGNVKDNSIGKFIVRIQNYDFTWATGVEGTMGNIARDGWFIVEYDKASNSFGTTALQSAGDNASSLGDISTTATSIAASYVADVATDTDLVNVNILTTVTNKDYFEVSW